MAVSLPSLPPSPPSTLLLVLVLERLLALARVHEPGPRTEPVPKLKADVEDRLPEDEEELVLRRRPPPAGVPAAKEEPGCGWGKKERERGEKRS